MPVRYVGAAAVDTRAPAAGVVPAQAKATTARKLTAALDFVGLELR